MIKMVFPEERKSMGYFNISCHNEKLIDEKEIAKTEFVR